ncbi:MAG: hypothetical protein ACM3IJ_04405 [Candidatus Levyibacteriota bacterium]
MNLFAVRRISLALLLVIALNAVLPILSSQKASAANLTEASIRLDRLGAAVASNTTNAKILVVVKPSSTATEGKLKITWPDTTSNGFTVDATNTNHTTSTTGLPATYHGESLNSWPTIQANATSVTDNGNTTDVIYTSGDLTAGQLYGFWITGGITNPSNANAGQHTITITTQTGADADIDTSTVAVDTLGTLGDQVTLTATVPPSFSFVLSGNSISLGTLSTSARTTGNVTATISTNANNGWIAFMRSEGAAATLDSATTGDSISSTKTGSCVTAANGAKGYVVDVNAAAGSSAGGALTVATEYDCTDNQAGGVLATTYDQIADRTGVVDSDVLTLNAVVTISATTKAATDYTDTWEVVGAGDF